MVAVYEGAPAVTQLRLPISPELPAPIQFEEVIKTGQDISAATTKLKTLSGLWQRFSRLSSDFFALVGAGVGVATPLGLDKQAFDKLRSTTDRDAQRLRGKTAAERRARRLTPGSVARDVLTDEELGVRGLGIRGLTPGQRQAIPGLMGTPAEVPQPAGEPLGGKLDTIIDILREGVIEAGDSGTRPFWVGQQQLEPEIRIDTIPAEP
jgi:hypothetical protein